MISRLKNKKIFIITFALAFCFILFSNSSVFAEEDKTGIRISPVEDRIGTLDPGAVYKNTLVATNTSSKPVYIEVEVVPFQVNEDYAPVFNVSNEYTQITRWIKAECNVEILEPGESTDIYYTITVPRDVPGGGQYAAISVSASEVNEGKEVVKTIANAAYTIAARVSGVTRETGEIIEQKVSGFLLAPPIKASVKLSNTGNVDQDAKITVEIENAITGAKLYSNADSPKETSLLPETEKTVDMTFDNVLRLGVMRVTMTTDYINNHEKISRIVIIIPIWLIFILIAVVLLIIYKIASKKHNNSKKRSNSRGYETPSKDFNI